MDSMTIRSIHNEDSKLNLSENFKDVRARYNSSTPISAQAMHEESVSRTASDVCDVSSKVNDNSDSLHKKKNKPNSKTRKRMSTLKAQLDDDEPRSHFDYSNNDDANIEKLHNSISSYFNLILQRKVFLVEKQTLSVYPRYNRSGGYLWNWPNCNRTSNAGKTFLIKNSPTQAGANYTCFNNPETESYLATWANVNLETASIDRGANGVKFYAKIPKSKLIADGIRDKTGHVIMPFLKWLKEQPEFLLRHFHLGTSRCQRYFLSGGLGDESLDTEIWLNQLGSFPFNEREIKCSAPMSNLGYESTLWFYWMLDIASPLNAADSTCEFGIRDCIQNLCGIEYNPDYHPQRIYRRLSAKVLYHLITTTPDLDFNSTHEIHLGRKLRFRPDMDAVVVQTDNQPPPAQEPEGGEGLEVDMETNTAITGGDKDKEAEFVEEDATAEVVNDNLEDRFETCPNLVNRWAEIANFNMTSTNTQGQQLANINILADCLRAISRTPIGLTFNQYEFCIPKIKIKVVTNCSKFQLAACNIAFVYSFSDRDDSSSLLNLATLSTMPNVVLNGSFSTSVVIDIPYLNILPALPIYQNSWSSALSIGNLIATCMIPVRVGAGTTPIINYRVFITLEGTKFAGQRGFYTPIVPLPCTPNMISLKAAALKMITHAVVKPLIREVANKTKQLVDSAENSLVQTFDDVNRDAPEIGSRSMVFQTTGPDMAAGVGPQAMNKFRLNPLGTSQHHRTDVGKDYKFDLDVLKGCFGLEAIFEWTATQTPGSRIFETTTVPSMYEKATFGNLLVGNVSTPIDNMSSFFMSYRGKLEYKFVFITSGLHTGKLRITYEPNTLRTSTCDVDSVPFTIIDLASDLDANTTFGFFTPYQHANHHFKMLDERTPVKSNAVIQERDFRYRAGNMSIYVENALIAPLNVSDRVSVLVYKRGHPNIEFAIPRNVLDVNSSNHNNTRHSRIGVLISSTINGEANLIQAFLNSPASISTPMVALPNALQLSINGGGVLWKPWHVRGPYAVLPLIIQIGRTNALGSTYSVRTTYGNVVIQEAIKLAHDLSSFQFSAISENQPIWSAVTAIIPSPFASVPVPAGPIQARPDMLVHGEDFRFQASPRVIDLFPTAHHSLALQIGGEKHDDLKTLLRRKELWVRMSDSSSSIDFDPTAYTSRLSLTTGMPNVRNINNLPYVNGNNKITKISDMFRFWRGSLDYTLCVSSATSGSLSGITMTVTHVPGDSSGYSLSDNSGRFCVPSGYSTQVYSLNRNNVNTINIPHYTYGRYGINSSFQVTRSESNISSNRDLGSLFFRFSGPLALLNIDVYRSLGDDHHQYVFNGCPQRNLPIIETSNYYSGANGIRVPAIVPFKDLTEDGDVESNPGPVHSKFRPDMFKIGTNIERIAKSFEKISESASDSAKSFKGCTESFSDFISNDARLRNYADVILQILHVINNPTLRTFILSISSILLKVLPTPSLNISINGIKSFLKKSWKKLFGFRADAGQKDIESFWKCICDFCGMKYEKNDSFFKKIGALFRLGTMMEKIIGFIELVVDSFKLFANRIYKKFYPNDYLFEVYSSSEVKKLVSKYIRSANELLMPENETSVLCDRKNVKYLYKMLKYGKELQVSLLESKVKDKNWTPLLARTVEGLHRLSVKSVQSFNRPLARRVPFCVYLTGDPGTGKSDWLDDIGHSMLLDIGCKVINDPIFTKSAGTEWFDGWEPTHKILKYDDFASKNDTEAKDLLELIHIKSNGIYTGAFSDTVDKQKTVHPWIILVASNDPHPTNPAVKTQGAVHRRRDVLLNVKLSPQWKNCIGCGGNTLVTPTKGIGCSSCRDLNLELLSTGKHLTITELNCMTSQRFNNVTYDKESAENMIREKFNSFWQQEDQRYKLRMNKITELIMRTSDKPWMEDEHTQAKCSGMDAFCLEYNKIFQDEENQLIQRDGMWKFINGPTLTPDDIKPPEIFIEEGFNESSRFDFNLKPESLIEELKFRGDMDNVLIGGISLGLSACYAGYMKYKVSKSRRRDRVCICKVLDTNRLSEVKINGDSATIRWSPRDIEENQILVHTVKEYNDMLRRPPVTHSCNDQNMSSEYKRPILNVTYEGSAQISVRNDTGFSTYYIQCDECYISGKRHALQHDPVLHDCLCKLPAPISGDPNYYPYKAETVKTHGDIVDYQGKTYFSSCSNCLASRMVDRKILRIPSQFQNDNDRLADILTFTSTIFPFVVALSILRNLYKTWKSVFKPNSDSSYVFQNHQRVNKTGKVRSNAQRMKANMSWDVSEVTSKNYYTFEGEEGTGVMLMLKGKWGLTTSHSWNYLKGLKTIRVKAHSSWYNISPSAVECKNITSEDENGVTRLVDLVLLRIDGLPLARDITSHLATLEDLDEMSTHVQFYDCVKRSSLLGLPVNEYTNLIDYDEQQVYLNGLSYDFKSIGAQPNYEGRCMSLIIDDQRKKICAFHVCSSLGGLFASEGFAQILPKEVVEDLIYDDTISSPATFDRTLGPLFPHQVESLADEFVSMVNLKDYLKPITNVSPPVRHVVQTSIKPSPLYGLLGPTLKKPVCFTNEGEDIPGVTKMSAAIAKNEPRVHWNEDQIQSAFEAVRDDVLTNMLPKTAVHNIRSLDDCILGVPNVPNMPGMDLSTSTGFPLNYKFSNKKQIITITERRGTRLVHISKELQKALECNNADRALGIVPKTIFHAVLKDERRKEDKIHKPRLIQMAPVEYTIACRQRTMDFTASFYNNKLKTFSSIGVNCLGSDWQKMARKFEGKKLVCGDVGDFGPTLPHNLVEKCYEIINAWYSKFCSEDNVSTVNEQRTTLGKEITAGYNVCYDTIFKTECCSPSGQPLTVIINTMCMQMYLYMAFKEIAEKNDKSSDYQTFKRLVDTLVYGDDMIMAIDDDIISWFNNLSISECFTSHGIVYTDIDKLPVSKPFVDWKNSSFLGRSHKILEGKSVGALDLSLIKDIPNWTKCKTTKNIEPTMMSSCQSVLIESLFHGKEVFDEHYKILSHWWSQKGKNISDFNWDVLISKWRKDSLVANVIPFMLEDDDERDEIEETESPVEGADLSEIDAQFSPNFNFSNNNNSQLFRVGSSPTTITSQSRRRKQK